MWVIRLPVNPVPAARPKLTRSGKAYYPKTYSKFKGAASKAMRAAMMEAGFHKRLTGPLLVSLVFCVERPGKTKLQFPKPDVDNYAKAILDACNGHIWIDDEQVIALRAEKRWASYGEPGFTIIEVKSYDRSF